MSSPDDDGPDDGGPDDGQAAGDAADTGGARGAGAPEGAERRRRRRRRRAGGGQGDQAQGQGQPQGQPQQPPGEGQPQGQPQQPPGEGQQSQPQREGQDPQHGQPQPDQQGQPQQGQQRGGDNRGGGNRDQQRGGDNRGGGNRDQQRQPHQGQQRGGDNRGNRDQQRGGDNRGGGSQQGQQRGSDNRGGGNRDQQRGGDNRGPQRADNRGGKRDQQRGGGRRSEGRDSRESREQQAGAGGEADLRSDDDDLLRGDPYRTGDDDNQLNQPARQTPIPLDARPADEDEAPAAPSVSWGSEDDAPPPLILFAPDLPIDAPSDDPDPLTFPLVNNPGAQLGDDVASVVGVRFVPAGRIQYFDAGDGDYIPGERVMVDAERGARLGWIASAPVRRATRDRGLRRVIRRASDQDMRSERDGDADRTHALRIAKDKAAALKLPLKVFRVEKTSGKLNVYYTSDERLDLRDFVRDVGQATGLRLELRQLGVRDEAKAVGGIGSCGLTLCCTTWLPDFVPVSIKMAKDQGLVLSPTKVSGQCGRLKCCLVYEQAGYAELRKGLPKLGKRVVSAKGEGRVVEVDVLRQRVRVSYGAGDTEVLPATEVKPMFPPGNQRGPEREAEHESEAEHEPDLPDS